MKRLNYDFLEAYKALDKLCGDMYHSKFGVTNYIDHMKEETWDGKRNVPYWDYFLERLVHYRHIRNKLTHDIGSLESISCTHADINWIQDFQESILKRTDPISELLRKRVRTKQAEKEQARAARKEKEQEDETNLQINKFLQILLIVLSVILLFIVFNLIRLWL